MIFNKKALFLRKIIFYEEIIKLDKYLSRISLDFLY